MQKKNILFLIKDYFLIIQIKNNSYKMSEKINHKVIDNFLPKENFIKIKNYDFPSIINLISQMQIKPVNPLFYLTHLIYI